MSGGETEQKMLTKFLFVRRVEKLYQSPIRSVKRVCRAGNHGSCIHQEKYPV